LRWCLSGTAFPLIALHVARNLLITGKCAVWVFET
jgi:hypothetical protein